MAELKPWETFMVSLSQIQRDSMLHELLRWQLDELDADGDIHFTAGGDDDGEGSQPSKPDIYWASCGDSLVVACETHTASLADNFDADMAQAIAAASFVLNTDVDDIRATNESVTGGDVGQDYVDAARSVAAALRECMERNARLRQQATTCCFCKERFESQRELMDHSAKCAKHPLFVSNPLPAELGSPQELIGDRPVSNVLGMSNEEIDAQALQAYMTRYGVTATPAGGLPATCSMPIPVVDMPAQAMLESVRDNLPSGYTLQIKVSNGGVNMYLHTPYGNILNTPDAGLNLVERIAFRVNSARAASDMAPVTFPTVP